MGRTGTYITIDTALKMAHAEGKVDISGIVRKLREGRIKMVQANVSSIVAVAIRLKVSFQTLNTGHTLSLSK